MKVKLIQATVDPLDIMYTAARTCYSEKDAGELYEFAKHKDRSKKEELVLRVLNSGHLSIAEHIYLTFTIDRITRKTSHQLVRHRHATYSQKSQRYVTYHRPFTYTIPDSICNYKNVDPDNYFKSTYFKERFDALMSNIQSFYNEMVAAGIPAEDARDIFPNACHTSITFSGNLRQFIHMCEERQCTRAQAEIRLLFICMASTLVANPEYRFLAKFLKPKCYRCTEHEKCK